eukprot:TRINITY_DN593_c0_g1_i1.p1 TRINITY_DN593_c0_g1~~TRINITY_DN593_c0_g1_i1.p1  ORF type:complete len:328 (+),score=99.52 TRINITY_DN593_c0_g1_i1:39-1022(+)
MNSVMLQADLLIEQVENNNPAAVKKLIKEGANPESANTSGQRALHVSATRNLLDVTKVLLEAGGDVNSPDPTGKSPLQVACELGHLDIIKVMLADEDCIIGHRTFELAYAAIHFAANAGQLESVRLLLEKGEEVDRENVFGETALHLACQLNHYDVAKLLIDYKANPNHRTDNGKTPLHYCAADNSMECAKLLIDNDADPHMCDLASGITALDTARSLGFGPIVVVMKEAAASQWNRINRKLQMEETRVLRGEAKQRAAERKFARDIEQQKIEKEEARKRAIAEQKEKKRKQLEEQAKQTRIIAARRAREFKRKMVDMKKEFNDNNS